MNIFILDKDIKLSCQYHFDSHVVKMPLEYAQLLCSALRIVNGEEWVEEYYPWAYKTTHKNHPCTIWARESLENWLWLQEYAMWLGEEYTYRYNKTHKSVQLIETLIEPPDLPSKGLTPFAQAMPDTYKKSGDVVTAYRNYYINEKQHLASWKERSVPEFWKYV